MNISMLGDLKQDAQKNSKTKEEYIKVCEDIRNEIFSTKENAKEEIDKFNNFLADCDKLKAYFDKNNITTIFDETYDIPTSKSFKRVTNERERLDRITKYEESVAVVSKMVSLSTLSSSKMFEDILAPNTSRKEKAYLLPYVNSVDDFEKACDDFKNATPEERTKMFADKLKTVRKLTNNLFNAKNENYLIATIENNLLAFNSLGEYDKISEYIPHLKEAYGISFTEDMLKDIEYIKNYSVDAAKYQNVIGAMADPLYVELENPEDLLKYKDFVSISKGLTDGLDYEDLEELPNLDNGGNVTQYINTDISFVYSKESRTELCKTCLKLYYGEDDTPVFFDNTGRKITLEDASLKMTNGEKVKAYSNGQCDIIELKPGFLNTKSITQSKEKTIDAYTDTKDIIDYLKELKTSLEQQSTNYTNAKDFFGSNYSDVVKSLDSAMKGFTTGTKEQHLALLKDVEVKAAKYLDSKIASNDSSDLANRRVNAVLLVLSKIADFAISYEYEVDHQSNHDEDEMDRSFMSNDSEMNRSFGNQDDEEDEKESLVDEDEEKESEENEEEINTDTVKKEDATKEKSLDKTEVKDINLDEEDDFGASYYNDNKTVIKTRVVEDTRRYTNMTLKDYLSNKFIKDGEVVNKPTLDGISVNFDVAIYDLIDNLLAEDKPLVLRDFVFDKTKDKAEQYLDVYTQIKNEFKAISGYSTPQVNFLMNFNEDYDALGHLYENNVENFIKNPNEGYKVFEGIFNAASDVNNSNKTFNGDALTKENMAQAMLYYRNVKYDFDKKCESGWFRFKTHLFGKSAQYKDRLEDMKNFLGLKGVDLVDLTSYVKGCSMEAILKDTNVPSKNERALKEAQDKKELQDEINKKYEYDKNMACKKALDLHKVVKLDDYKNDITNALKASSKTKELDAKQTEAIGNAKSRATLINILVSVDKEMAKTIQTAWREDDKAFEDEFNAEYDAKMLASNNQVKENPLDLSNEIDEEDDYNTDINEYTESKTVDKKVDLNNKN